MTREIHLARRPDGRPVADDFAVVVRPVAEIQDGEVLVQNLILSVDPYMRPRLDADQVLDTHLMGGGIGRILQSRNKEFAEGDLVRHRGGMRERFTIDSTGVTRLEVDPAIPLSVYLHALGGTGLTAYGGLFDTGAMKDGEEVFVSTAAGAVGSVAVQIAKLKGCYVVGSTGSASKATWLRDELGVDVAINYNAEPIVEALEAATPRGIDIYFENVGGAHLDAALARMNLNGRIPVCGMISTYNGDGQGVHNLFKLIYARVRMQGFLTTDFAHLNEAFTNDMTQWLKDGQIKYQETVLDGFERAPEGLIGLFEGQNTGKMLIRLGA